MITYQNANWIKGLIAFVFYLFFIFESKMTHEMIRLNAKKEVNASTSIKTL